MKKTSWLITILVCLLIIVGGGAVVLCPRIVLPSQCSEVYKRYSKADGIDATFIKDYRVNDSVFVDVTVLEASNDSAWAVLKKEYKVPALTPKQKIDMENGSPCIAFCGLHKKDERAKYTNENTLVVAMHNNSTIYVFYSKTSEHCNAIMDMLFKKYYLGY